MSNARSSVAPLTDCVHAENSEEQIICLLSQQLGTQQTGQFGTSNRSLWALHREP